MYQAPIDPQDFLLIHCTNYTYEPFYPYAFVMISARARRAGLKVKRLELSNLDGASVDFWLQDAIARYRPRMVGFTLRQTDSYVFKDYVDCEPDRYYPVMELKNHVKKVRALTDAKIAVGGFGFTLHATDLSAYLDIDYGVQGECDPFIENFDDLIEGRNLEAIPNLVYRGESGYRANGRVFTPPFSGLEYNDEMADEITAYYGRSIVQGRGYMTTPHDFNPMLPGYSFEEARRQGFLSLTPTIPIEVSRGCRFRCYFCSEPLVKGNKVNERDLDLIEEEVRFLVSKNLRHVWFICSELNAGSNDFPLRIAERMLKLNETLGELPVSWKAYHLPRWVSKDDLGLLYRSGFTTSWNDIVSFDDDQLREGRNPFRARHAIQFIKDDYAIREKYNKLPPLVFSLFLGDAFMTRERLSETLFQYNENRLTETCIGGAAICGMRVFDSKYNKIPLSESVTFTPAGMDDPELIHPTYRVPPEVMEAFGSYGALIDFYDYICDTMISTSHRDRKDWTYFLAAHASPIQLMSWLKSFPETALEASLLKEERTRLEGNRYETRIWARFETLVTAPTEGLLRDQLWPEDPVQSWHEQVSRLLVLTLYARFFEDFKPVLEFLEVPSQEDGSLPMTEYELLRALYEKAESMEAMTTLLNERFPFEPGTPNRLMWNHLVYQYNVRLDPRHKPWLFTSKTADLISTADARK